MMTPQPCRKVSVVVPARNEEHSIGELLESLRAQTRTPDEVVICDGGSTDRTAAIVEGFSNHGLSVRLLRTGPALPGRARNAAIEGARFEIIALTDAGVRLHPQWLEQLVAPFEGPSFPDVVYGRYEPVMKSFRQRCIALAFVPAGDASSGLRGPSVASMAMRRSVWTRAGRFREDLRSGEDLLFFKAVSRLGAVTQYSPKALVFWTPPENFAHAFKRFAAYSHSGIRAGLVQEWQLPLLRIYVLMALLTLTARWTPFGLLAPILVMGARAARRIARERGFASLLNLPVLTGVAAALITIDIATLVGCLRWLAADWIPSIKRRLPLSLAR